MPNRVSTTNRQAAVNVLSGPALRRNLHGKREIARAKLAAQLIRNKVSFDNLSRAQVARLCKVNDGNLACVLGRTGTRGPQQRTINRIAKKYSADVLMRALDFLTAPSRTQAAE
jgi:hypothetical protein